MYKPGQKLVCIIDGNWGMGNKQRPVPGPSKGEIVTLHMVDRGVHTGFYWLTEYLYVGGCYNPKYFRPPVDISDEVKNSFPEIIEEKIEQPILEPA